VATSLPSEDSAPVGSCCLNLLRPSLAASLLPQSVLDKQTTALFPNWQFSQLQPQGHETDHLPKSGTFRHLRC
jgi:hypothetical protein